MGRGRVRGRICHEDVTKSDSVFTPPFFCLRRNGKDGGVVSVEAGGHPICVCSRACR